MDRRDESESEGSFTDTQYDMIDDLSEFSDGNDTASIASNGDDGRTPDDSQSEVDLEESTLLLHQDSRTTDTSAFPPFVDINGTQLHAASTRHSHAAAIQAENELIDSYWPDDLETPRQSTVADKHSPFDSSALPSKSDVRRLLFVSEPKHAQSAIMDAMYLKLAACLDHALDEVHSYKVVQFPATPSGNTLPSAVVVRARDSVSATVQHCIDVNVTSTKSYRLQILDNDKESSTFFTISDSNSQELPKPDLAVFYLEPGYTYAPWFKVAEDAINSQNVPIIFVSNAEDNFTHSKLVSRGLSFVHGKASDSFSFSDIVNMNAAGTVPRQILDITSFEKPTPTKVTRQRAGIRGYLKIIVFSVVLLIFPYLLAARLYSTTDPAVELATRREGLISALLRSSKSTAALQQFDIGLLLPESLTECPQSDLQCHTQLACQVIPPNYMIVSRLDRPYSQGLDSVKVYTTDGRQPLFNVTTLIDGVYEITLDVDEAYGEVFVNMQTAKPFRNSTTSHDFGNRLLQRRTYERAGNDMGKEVSKDVAYMRQRARSLSEKLPATIGAGVSATANVTTDIALHMARDLQVFGSTAMSIFSKAAQAGNETVHTFGKELTTLRKELTTMRKDLLVKFTSEVSAQVRSHIDSAKNYSRALLRKPLYVSRERLQNIKKASGFTLSEKEIRGRRCKKSRKGSDFVKQSHQAKQMTSAGDGISCPPDVSEREKEGTS